MAAVRHDRLGGLAFLAFAAPVRPGEEDAVHAAIAALPTGEDAPLAGLGIVHHARLVVLADLPEPGWSLLWFSAVVDGTFERFVAGLRRHAPAAAMLEAVLGCCQDWAGASSDAALARFLGERRVRTDYALVGHPDATVGAIRRALARREAVVRLAQEAPSLTPAQLRAAFAERVAP